MTRSKQVEGKKSIMLIRNKKDTQRLSKSVAESAKLMRQERYAEAVQDDDWLYLISSYDALSTRELLRLLLTKIKYLIIGNQ